MKHKFLTEADCKHSHDDMDTCPVYQGLSICAVCGPAEGQLTTDCPGVISTDKGDITYAGDLDFVVDHGGFNPKDPKYSEIKKKLKDTNIEGLTNEF
jgi:hypothetical protein